MNTYVAFYRKRKVEVEAKTSYEAQIAAAVLLNARKRYEVTVVLAKKDGVPVTHHPDF